MGTVRTDEFRKDAVRIALTSGLPRKQIADDLGVGMSTLNKWITAHPLPGSGLLANRERGRVGRLMRETGIIVERTRKFKVEEDEEMIRGIISPTTDGQRPQVHHRAKPVGPGFCGRSTEPEMPSHGLQANHCRVTGG